jgi:hypothetical protein
MDWENFLYGLVFIFLTGVTILVYLHRIGDFDKGEKITRNTVGLISGALIGIFGGLYFLIRAL